ncbi:MAG: FimV/HubP family polar landmark protein, partial [Gammaproteobacteria bacterium]
GVDLDFGLDDAAALDGLDTLALDPNELRADTLMDKTVKMPRDADLDYQDALIETDTKLNLAKAYIELGDTEGARAILNEVVVGGSDAQQDEAHKLLAQLS